MSEMIGVSQAQGGTMPKVFISHASEDKQAVAKPLAEKLREAGYEVWYDEYALTLGDSLRRSIDWGLADADYGIVVLSPAFFAKSWTQLELGGLTALATSGNKTILPVWHKVGRVDVERFSPMLADRLSVSTDDGIAAVVAGIQQVIQGKSMERPHRKFAAPSWRALLVLGMVAILGIGSAALYSKTLAPRFARAKLDALPLRYTPETFVEKAGQGNLEVVKLFLKAGMNPDIHEPLLRNELSGRTALAVAAGNGHIKIVEALLNSNANVNERDEYFGVTALSWAVSEGHLDIVRLLLRAGADDKAKNEAVGSAFGGGHMEALHVLWANGAKLDLAMAQKAFSDVASSGNNVDILKYLLSLGVDVNGKNDDGGTALHYAARYEHAVPAIQLILQHGADVNARNNNGETPIMGLDSVAVVRVLIDAGADVNAKDNRGTSVLTSYFQRAISQEVAQQIVTLLIARGADVNLPVSDPPISPLMDYLARQDYQNPWLFDLLIESGADVNFKNQQGYSPLLVALYFFFDRWGEDDDDWLVAVVRRLVEKGANRREKAADGTTAIALAEKLPRGPRFRITKLLKS